MNIAARNLASKSHELDTTKAGTELWDRLGVVASVLCALHCMAAPLLFLAAPAFAGIWAHPSSHALIALFVLPLAGTVLFRGYQVHRMRWVAGAAILGALFIVVGSALPLFESGGVVAQEGAACASCCPQLISDESGETSLGWPPASISTVVGSVFLVVSHLGNLTHCRCCAGHSAC